MLVPVLAIVGMSIFGFVLGCIFQSAGDTNDAQRDYEQEYYDEFYG